MSEPAQVVPATVAISNCCQATVEYKTHAGFGNPLVCGKCGEPCYCVTPLSVLKPPVKTPTLRTPEVEFNADERALLDVLNRRVANDGCVHVNDTQLIAELGLSPEDVPTRFFAPKMRLVTAGVISLFVNANGAGFIRLNMPERKKQRSERYVVVVIPLELADEIRELVSTHRVTLRIRERHRVSREKRRARKEKEPQEQIPTAAEPQITEHKRPVVQFSQEHRFALAQAKLGIHQVQPGPIRPPLAKGAMS